MAANKTATATAPVAEGQKAFISRLTAPALRAYVERMTAKVEATRNEDKLPSRKARLAFAKSLMGKVAKGKPAKGKPAKA